MKMSNQIGNQIFSVRLAFAFASCKPVRGTVDEFKLLEICLEVLWLQLLPTLAIVSYTFLPNSSWSLISLFVQFESFTACIFGPSSLILYNLFLYIPQSSTIDPLYVRKFAIKSPNFSNVEFNSQNCDSPSMLN